MAAADDWLEIPEAAAELNAYDYQLRRLADVLEAEGKLQVLRANRVRLIRRSQLPLLAAELAKRPAWARPRATAAV